MTTVAEVLQVLEQRYPLALAEPWDRVGLVCGDPAAAVGKVGFAVDATEATVAEAIEQGAQLLVVHHPLLLRGVHSVARSTPKGGLVHDLIRAGTALYTAHTNADSAHSGVSAALAERIGIVEAEPLAGRRQALDRLVVFVPATHRDQLIDAVDAVIGPVLGDYTRCAFWTDGVGTFVPGPTAHPTIGERGERTIVDESRVDITIPRARRAQVVAAVLAAHPYEEPAYDVLELADVGATEGLGRVGRLARPRSFADFVAQVATVLPATAAGVRAAGDRDRRIARVAVCGGAGDSLLDAAAAAGADAYVTADLRHHPAAEAVAAHGLALVDVGHWASEWPWLSTAAALVRAAFPDSVDTAVSRLVTDPWTMAIVPQGE